MVLVADAAMRSCKSPADCPSPGGRHEARGSPSSSRSAPNLAAALVGSKIGCERAGTSGVVLAREGGTVVL